MSASAADVSAEGQKQMAAVLAYARSHNAGNTGGRCYEYVWRYLTTVGYGKIKGHSSLPAMGSRYARDFADYMNSSPSHLAAAGTSVYIFLASGF